MQLKALESTLSKGATIVADPTISPFNLLLNSNTNTPGQRPNGGTRQPRNPALSATDGRNP
jgi:hypothetical protein